MAKEEKPQRCLGLNCEVLLPRFVFFCPKCKAIKNNTKLSRAEEPRKVIISHKITKDQY